METINPSNSVILKAWYNDLMKSRDDFTQIKLKIGKYAEGAKNI